MQGAAAKLASYEFPPDRQVLLMSYDRPFEANWADCFFSDTATWAEGRNLLARQLADKGPLPDYVIFCDDDVVFETGSFAALEEHLSLTRPMVGAPLMPKAAESPTLRPRRPVQRALVLDEQIVALHRSAMGIHGIAPLETRFDNVSWYVACLTFEYLCISRFGPFCHQYNDIRVLNPGHNWETGGTLYHRGEVDEWVTVWRNEMMSLTGGFKAHVVEQFDNRRLSRLRRKLASLGHIKSAPAR